MVPNLDIAALLAHLNQLSIKIGRYVLLALADEQSHRGFDQLDTIKGGQTDFGVKNRQGRFGTAQKFNKLALFFNKPIGGFGS